MLLDGLIGVREVSTTVSKELLERFYYKDEMSQKQIAKKLGISQSEVSRMFKELGIKSRRVWTKEDIEYLEDHYGVISFKTIAKNLYKTPYGVSVKARRLGLGSALTSTEYLNSSELSIALNIDRKTVQSWIKRRGLKASLKTVTYKRKFYRINLKDFWKWAETHKDFIRWSKVEINVLGKEPSWVCEARKEDAKRGSKENTRWAKADDALLISYWNRDLPIKNIVASLGRSKAGILRRAKRLNLNRRKIVLSWQPIEVETLIKMKLEGYRDSDIAEELGRDTEGVAWKRKQLIKQGKLNWKYNYNKKVTQAPTKVS